MDMKLTAKAVQENVIQENTLVNTANQRAVVPNNVNHRAANCTSVAAVPIKNNHTLAYLPTRSPTSSRPQESPPVGYTIYSNIYPPVLDKYRHF